MELTPRTADEAAPATPERRRRVMPMLMLVLVVGGLGLILFFALDDATTYFYNADEAIEQRESLGDSRFRLQGMVLEGVEHTGDGAEFEVMHNCAVVRVRHTGDPPQMFEAGIPAVVEGNWATSGDHVETDRLFVAHDAEYEEAEDYDADEMAERVEAAEESGAYDRGDCPEPLRVEGETADAE